ncbi:MAG: GNAT family N-acetyltransferase [Paracoccaceae bacterium]|nr:GNAT family N-acetyltransferase [Paracoccaceae bacterium]
MSELATPTISIQYVEGASKARYVAQVDGHAEEAELTLSKLSDSLIIADHTYVPDTFRGMGIARLLAERLIADARAKGQRIVPLCPFVRAHAAKNREALSDVIQW